MTGKPNTAPMSNEEYMRRDGNHCPFCHSVQIRAGSPDVCALEAWQPVVCTQCGGEWTDVFKMVGYEKIDLEG